MPTPRLLFTVGVFGPGSDGGTSSPTPEACERGSMEAVQCGGTHRSRGVLERPAGLLRPGISLSSDMDDMACKVPSAADHSQR